MKKGEIVPWKKTKLSTATNPTVGQKTTKNKRINKQTKLTNKPQYAVNQKHEKIYQIIHDESDCS